MYKFDTPDSERTRDLEGISGIAVQFWHTLKPCLVPKRRISVESVRWNSPCLVPAPSEETLAKRIDIGAVVLVLVLGVTATARAQSVVKDQGAGSVVGGPGKQTSWFQQKFAGSFAETGTFVGSGSFYSSGYRNPYVAGYLYMRPRFNLGTKLGLALNMRLYQVLEFTQPDEPTDRRWAPLDVWLWLSAGNLYTEPRSKIRLSGQFRLVIPSSYESIYANLALGTALGLNLSRGFKLPRDFGLSLSLGTVFTKNFHTKIYRGNGPGDSTGCRGIGSPSGIATGPLGEQPTFSDTDTCGGFLNTNFSFVTAGSIGLSWKKVSFGITLIVVNAFKYAFPKDQYQSVNAVARGQVDSTWGMLSLGYDVNDHLNFSLGMSSFQPVRTADQKGVRFPFFDFSSGNAANNTQVFVSMSGTL